MENLIAYVKEIAKKHPQVKEEVFDLLELCMDEIEEGGSKEHEIDLCRRDIDNILAENNLSI
jgi:hypothetical protein